MTTTGLLQMVVDTSAIEAVLFGEEGSDAFLAAMDRSSRVFMSSFSWLESAVVTTVRKGEKGQKKFHELMMESAIEIIPFDRGQAEIAFDTWLRYGKGRHHASLNIGDCCSYALARSINKGLLYKGEDFSLTDIPAAIF